MANVAIIGMGNIGFRHLQGALEAISKLNIYCVDPLGFDLEKVGLINQYTEKNIIVEKTCDNLPNDIDIAIIATTADIRYDVFSEIIKKDVKNVIFEKVLFQKIKYYKDVEELLNKYKINAWVNCILETGDSWKEIKKIIDNRQFTLNIHGANWGLGCNTIHHLHLIDFLDGTNSVSIDEFLLSDCIVDSKRKGFKEIYGQINGHSRNCRRFSFECSDKGKIGRFFDIELDDMRISVDEPNKTMRIVDIRRDGMVRDEAFYSPYVSNTTGKVIDEILVTAQCGLPDYRKSMKLHLQFVEPLIEFFENNGGDKGICPIT